MKDYDDVADSIAYWREVLKCQDHKISLLEQQCDDDACATIETQPQIRHATICLAHDFFEMGEDEQEEVILHELVHLITNPILHCVYRCIEHLGKAEKEIISKQVTWEIECATDKIKDIVFDLEKLVPESPPEKPDKSKDKLPDKKKK